MQSVDKSVFMGIMKNIDGKDVTFWWSLPFFYFQTTVRKSGQEREINL